MKVGDRVVVVATSNEYSGCYGTITELTKDGRVVVAVDARPITWTASFQPHDIEPAQRVCR